MRADGRGRALDHSRRRPRLVRRQPGAPTPIRRGRMRAGKCCGSSWSLRATRRANHEAQKRIPGLVLRKAMRSIVRRRLAATSSSGWGDKAVMRQHDQRRRVRRRTATAVAAASAPGRVWSVRFLRFRRDLDQSRPRRSERVPRKSRGVRSILNQPGSRVGLGRALRHIVRLGLRVADCLRQHLAQLSLGFRGSSCGRCLPMCHGLHMGSRHQI